MVCVPYDGLEICPYFYSVCISRSIWAIRNDCLTTFKFSNSASMSNMAKIEEMERLLREAQVEKQRLLEHRVRL